MTPHGLIGYLCVVVLAGSVVPCSAVGQSSSASDSAADMMVPVSFPRSPETCTEGALNFRSLGDAYFRGTTKLQDDLTNLFTACASKAKLTGTAPYTIVVFLARATDGSEQPTVVHFIYSRDGTLPLGSSNLPGVDKLTFLYVSDHGDDQPVIQLALTHTAHPLVSQIGKLAEAIIGPFGTAFTMKAVLPEGARTPKPTLTKTYFWTVNDVPIKFSRGTIAESDFVSVSAEDPTTHKVEPKEVTGGVTFANTPLTTMTFNAGIAGIAYHGGAQQLKVDSGTYASDPLSYVATLAGVTFHHGFDSTAAVASPNEKKGLFVGGIVTPAAGFAICGTYGWRGFSIIGGYGLMFVHVAPGKNAGDAVVAGTDQLKIGYAHVILIGGSYAFGSS